MIKSLGRFKDFSDESLKSVFQVGDKNIIEMTLLFNKKEMDVVCVPSHHFCNLGCKMCHLTNNSLNKKMIPIKSDDFIKCLISSLVEKKNGETIKITSNKKLLISFMGVGDPLLNLKLIEEVFKREKELKKLLGYESIGYAISTMMPNNNVLELTKLVNELNIPLKLHFSLHTPIDEERFNLIPSTKVNVEEALSYLVYYRNRVIENEKIMQEYIKFHRTEDPIEIHYTLIANQNDGEKELKETCKLLSKYKIAIKFIKFNPLGNLRRSENENLWVDTLKQSVPKIRIKTYNPPGHEIGSSCGEFTKHYYHEEIESLDEYNEFKIWETKHKVDDDLDSIEEIIYKLERKK